MRPGMYAPHVRKTSGEGRRARAASRGTTAVSHNLILCVDRLARTNGFLGGGDSRSIFEDWFSDERDSDRDCSSTTFDQSRSARSRGEAVERETDSDRAYQALLETIEEET